MSESSLCPLWTNAALLRPIAQWALDTFGEDAPVLLGVTLGSTKVQFHPIYLDEDDPTNSLAELVAPDSWEFLVVVVDVLDAGAPVHNGVVAHAIDRLGRSATELDDWCGRRRSLRMLRGPLHESVMAVFTGVR